MSHDVIAMGYVLVLWRLLVFRCPEQTSDAKGKREMDRVEQEIEMRRTVFPGLE